MSKKPVHYAEFEFRPDFDWSKESAARNYIDKKKKFETKYLSSVQLNQIYFEDCIPGIKKIPDQSIDLLVCDPPFGINFSENHSTYNRNKDNCIKGYFEVKSHDYAEFSKAWISKISRILKETGSAFIFSSYNNLRHIENAFADIKFHLVNHIIWEYQFPVFTKKKFATTKYHVLFYVKNLQKRFFNRIGFYEKDIWKINRPYMNGKKKNGTKLPEELIKRIIGYCSKPGDVILDLFMGNGTTGIVAKKQYRHFIGWEINTNARELLKNNLNVEIGSGYIPYNKQIPTIDELKDRPGYFKAYLQYCQDHGIKPKDRKKR